MARFAIVKTNSTPLKAAMTVGVAAPLPSWRCSHHAITPAIALNAVIATLSYRARGRFSDNAIRKSTTRSVAAANAQNAMSVRHFCAAERKAPSVGGLTRKTAYSVVGATIAAAAAQNR